MSSNTFCRHLSNGFRIYVNNNDITWAPCCFWDGKPMPFQDLQEVRKKINISTPWAHRECQKCRAEESFKPGYRRSGSIIIPDGLPDTKTAWLDIQADTTCNGGCLICGPHSSSFWQSELAKYNEFTLLKNNDNIKESIEKIFSSIDISELRLIQFLGGEPFLSDADSFALPKVPNPSMCDVKYTTNGSIYPKAEKIKLWESFKSVLVNYSIDAVGPRFDYLRYPLNWKKVNENVVRLINETDNKVKFHINHTVTPFNIFYYQEFIDWINETFPADRFTSIHTHPAYGIMSVKNTSKPLRDMVINRYGPSHLLSKMLLDNPKIDSKEFWNYVNTWDRRRNQNWKEIFPELVGILDT